MRRAAILAALAAAALLAAPAPAVQLRAGDILITADGGFAPKALPRDRDAPVVLHGGGRISTVSGRPPPVLKTITIEFDRHGSVDTTGLPTCRLDRLEATTTKTARRVCGDALVGSGFGRAEVALPEQDPFPVSSPILLFNGPPEHGDPTVIAHAYITQPVPVTFVIPIVIERIHKGLYGYRTSAAIPKIANGYGVPAAGFLRVGRRWTYRGRRHSYVNARCANGRLQARGEFSFDDGTELSGTFLRPCRVR